MNSERRKENRLIEDLLAGSEAALQVFYSEYGSKLRKQIYFKISSSEDAEEILQDTLLSALDSLILFSGQSSLSTWLYSIARHEIADYYRRKRIRTVVFSKIPTIEKFVSRALEPDAGMLRREYERQVSRALDEMLPHYREVLELKYMDNLSIKEIAAKMGMSFKACESLLARARQAFALIYEENR